MAAPLEQVAPVPLTARSAGRPEIAVGVVDGLVALGHPGFAGGRLRLLSGGVPHSGFVRDADGSGASGHRGDASCVHGTFVAGLLGAGRTSQPPGICPGCTLLVRPVFGAGLCACRPAGRGGPAARPEELAAAIVEAVDAGARVLNPSVAPDRPSSTGHRELERALDHAANHGVITVVAAGNQGVVGTSVLTRHPRTLPVVAYDRRGRPMNPSDLGGSIGARGIGAPGEGVVGLGAGGRPPALTGTSAAAPFVAGTVALLLSEFPAAPPAAVRVRPPAHRLRAAPDGRSAPPRRLGRIHRAEPQRRRRGRRGLCERFAAPSASKRTMSRPGRPQTPSGAAQPGCSTAGERRGAASCQQGFIPVAHAGSGGRSGRRSAGSGQKEDL